MCIGVIGFLRIQDDFFIMIALIYMIVNLWLSLVIYLLRIDLNYEFIIDLNVKYIHVSNNFLDCFLLLNPEFDSITVVK